MLSVAKLILKNDGKLLSLKNGNKQTERKKMRLKKIEIELFKIKNAYNPTELEYELKVLNKIEVIDLFLRQTENYILGEHTG